MKKGSLILCICLLLAVTGCSSGQQGQTGAGADATSPGGNMEIGDAVLPEGSSGAADDTENGQKDPIEQTEPAITSFGDNMETGDAEDEVLSEDDRESAGVTENEQKELAELPECYAELIMAATAYLEGNAEEDVDYDFTDLFRLNLSEDAKAQFGYLMEDIDGDGTEELIFGENGPEAWDGVVYDLYTIHDGELVHVFDGWDRNRYYLCENGMIANEGSSGAAYSEYSYYVFEGTELHLVEAVLYNGTDSPDNPWLYSTTTNNCFDLDNAEPIDEDRAWAIIEEYVYTRPTFISFTGK